MTYKHIDILSNLKVINKYKLLLIYVYYVIFIIPINVYLKYLDLTYGIILSLYLHSVLPLQIHILKSSPPVFQSVTLSGSSL